MIGCRRRTNPANTTTAITPTGAVKCKRPVARPAPYTDVRRSGGRSLTGLAGRLGGGSFPRAATRSHRDLAESFHDDDFDGGAALLLLQADLRHDRAFPPRDIPGRNPVERERQHVVPAQPATTECGKMRPQRLVRGQNVVLDQVLDHSTANAGRTTEAVNVEPVVPVRRTRTYSPIL